MGGNIYKLSMEAMKYLAIEVHGFVHVLNDHDELGGLIDLGIDHRVLGVVCDDQEFGDNCSTDCPAYRAGTCQARPIRDIDGKLWHVI